jgi:UDP-N-acetylmuramate--alanine ligase
MKRKIYFVGIKGTGMSGLAIIYKNLGYDVVGSDVEKKFFTEDSILKNKIKIYNGFSIENIKKEMPIDFAITSNAWTSNVETIFLKENGIKVLTYPEAVSLIFNNSFGIAICGTHGKSTTTAFLGKIFEISNLKTTVLVGSPVKDWESNVYFSGSDYFILEADEYKNAFLNYKPKIIILTSLDYDHPDFFKTKKEYKESFIKFFRKLTGPKILISYHKFKLPKIKQIKLKYNPKIKFDFYAPGEHWQKNLQLVYKFCDIFEKKFKIENFKNNFFLALKEFKGVKRRFDILSENPILVDDYGHHPKELISFYNSLKLKFKNKNIYLIFQPHTYSRTEALFEEFKNAFKKIKNLIIFKTFSSAREGENKEIELKIKKLKNEIGFKYFDDREKLKEFLIKKIKRIKNIVIATCGAGDIYEILEEIKGIKNK